MEAKEVGSQLRILRRAFRALVGIALAQSLLLIVLIACAWKPPDGIVEATEFSLKSKSGDVVGRWFIDDNGVPNFHLRGKDSQLRVALDAEERGGALMLSTGTGAQVEIQSQKDESGSIVLSDAEGHSRVWIQAGKPLGPVLQVRDTAGKVVWAAPEK